MKQEKMQKKINNKNNKNTFEAIVDVVSYSENIQYYSYTRDDYTEIAYNAIINNSDSIEYVSPLCKGYPYLCSVAIEQDASAFLLVDESASNYKELGIKALMKHCDLVYELKKFCKHYIFFWKFAISLCYKTISLIDNDKGELFPLIAQVIDKNPTAIYFVNTDIRAYNNLCRFAYSRSVESLDYMCINSVNEKLAFEIIKRNPYKVLELSYSKEYYKKALELAIRLDGNVFKHIHIYNNDLDYYLSLFEIAKNTAPDVSDSSSALLMLSYDNRRQRKMLIEKSSTLDDALDHRISILDSEYENLHKAYIEMVDKEHEPSKNDSIKRPYSRYLCPFRKP